MASVAIPISRFKSADLPPICASSGVPAANVFRLKIAGVSGGVPLHSDVVKAISRVQLTCKIAFVTALGVFIVGVATRNGALFQIASVPLVISIGLFSAARARVPSGVINGDDLMLKRVHIDFVKAIAKPPGKCADCSGAGSCSVADMAACDTHSHEHEQTKSAATATL